MREFVDAAAADLGVSLRWEGEGLSELGIVASVSGQAATGKTSPTVGQVIVRVDPRYFRPTEVGALLGDPSKAKAKLGWEPKVGFRELVSEMVREMIIHAAGRVGGIQANMREPVRFLLENLDMGRNIVWAARKAGIRRLLNLFSSNMVSKCRKLCVENTPPDHMAIPNI